MKTDNRKLFEYSVISFTNYGYTIDDISLDLHNDDIPNIETEYETKFSNLGQVIYMINVKKQKNTTYNIKSTIAFYNILI